jgi:CheY-like chemotaxis protein
MKKILVVDDNLMMRKLIVNLFRNEGYAFEEASDGIEALEYISHTDFDLVITDIIMPKMEGIELIIHARKKRPDLKIIAISGSKPFYLYMAKRLGIECVFTKPLNHHGFLNKVNRMLNDSKPVLS